MADTMDGFGDVDTVLEIIIAQSESPKGVLWFASTDPTMHIYAATGLLAKAISKGDMPAIMHFAKQVRRSLETMASNSGIDIGACRAQAWNEIKDRRGRMVNGVFVKDA